MILNGRWATVPTGQRLNFRTGDLSDTQTSPLVLRMVFNGNRFDPENLADQRREIRQVSARLPGENLSQSISLGRIGALVQVKRHLPFPFEHVPR